MDATKISFNETNGADIQIFFENAPIFFFQELPLILGSLGCVFNTLLIYYFLKTRKYRSPTFMMLTSLSFTDLLSCIALILKQVFNYPSMLFPEAPYSCPLVIFFSSMGTYTSAFHLVFFAAVRFYQLASPLAACARISPEFILKLCLAIWVVVLILNIPHVYYFTGVTVTLDGDTVAVCTFVGDNNIEDLCFLIVATIIPCTSIVLLHVGKHIVVSCNKGKSLEVQQERKNTDARVITIVIVLFLIAWFPAFTHMTIMHGRIENYQNSSDKLFLTLLFFVYYNSVINPLIYCFALKSVREDIFRTLCSSFIQQKAC